MSLTLGAWYPLLQKCIPSEGHGIAFAENGQKGFIPILQALPRLAFGLRSRISRIKGNEPWMNSNAFLVLRRRERRPIGPPFFFIQLPATAAINDSVNGQPG